MYSIHDPTALDYVSDKVNIDTLLGRGEIADGWTFRDRGHVAPGVSADISIFRDKVEGKQHTLCVCVFSW